MTVTLGVGNVVQWQWASTEQINLNVVLSHVNTSMLATPIVLASASKCTAFLRRRSLIPSTSGKFPSHSLNATYWVKSPPPLHSDSRPAAGDGYVVTLYDATSNTSTFLVSIR